METVEKRLDSALRKSDDRRRLGRIERTIWLSDHAHLPSAIMGRTETLHLLTETREVFIEGHYIATLLLAISVINHALIEELQLCNAIKGDPGLTVILAKCEELRVIPIEWLIQIRTLVSRRHPFVHLKEQEYKHGLGSRVIQNKVHPAHLLEQDARDAIIVMYKVFRKTLREFDPMSENESD